MSAPYLVTSTPLEDHLADHGLLVKREDLSCLPPGPPFSKTRGVYSHMVTKMGEGFATFGVLDTVHSQGGLAVAHAGSVLGARVVNFYPVYKGDEGHAVRPLQAAAERLGAGLYGLKAGRSAVLYHQARRVTEAGGGWMFPNALKLPETVEETAAEVVRTLLEPSQIGYVNRPWLVSASSGTIAAGVLRGLVSWYTSLSLAVPDLIVHMGYERPTHAVEEYVHRCATTDYLNSRRGRLIIIQDGYAYKDVARPGPDPAWPSNAHYDLKAYRWWMAEGRARWGEAVMWNIG